MAGNQAFAQRIEFLECGIIAIAQGERACLLTDSRSIGVDHLFDPPVAATEPQSAGGNLRDYLNECERDFIVRALDTSQWQIQACADVLGISRKTLWEKMRRLGIDRAEEADVG